MVATGRIEIRGVELAWERAGDGPLLVWGHGLTSSRSSEDDGVIVDWPAVRRRLDVVRYDARGHGESTFVDDPPAHAWSELALDQLALADALGIDRYVAGGASMGTATALHVAVRAPERIAALVLVIPPTAWESRAAQIEQYETMASIIDREGVEPLIVAGAQTPPPDPFADGDEWQTRRAREMRAADPVRLAGLLRGAGHADLPPRDLVAEIAVPTLILAWSGDPGHPVSTAEELDRLIVDTRLHIATTAAELATWSERIADFVTEIG